MELGRYCRRDSPPFLIAEAGVNHEGRLETALELVRLAKEAGVDAIKFQTYKASRLASRNSPAYWDTTKEPARSQFELFSRYDSFGPEEFRKISEECIRLKLMFMSTPFDPDCVEWLDPLVSLHKIASADITNPPLLVRVAETRKPVLLSTGASTLEEIRSAVGCLEQHGASQVAVLHCVLSYPTRTEDAGVGALVDLKAQFPGYPLGYSVHTKPEDSFAAISAGFVLGARIFEKHFTHDKSLPGNDHYHAFDARDFMQLRRDLDRLSKLLGGTEKRVLPCEENARKYARRSLVTRRRIPKGTRIEPDMLDAKRPGTGIEPARLNEVLGQVAKVDIPEDEILRWEMIH